MLDQMGVERQLKLKQDLQRLEAEKDAEKYRQLRIRNKNTDVTGKSTQSSFLNSNSP